MILLVLVNKLLILVKTKYNNVIEKRKLGQGNVENRKQQKRRLQETTTTKNSNRIAMVVI